MQHSIGKRDRLTPGKKRKPSKAFNIEPTREEIASAVRDFLSNGGKIKRIEPEWIEEGNLYIGY